MCDCVNSLAHNHCSHTETTTTLQHNQTAHSRDCYKPDVELNLYVLNAISLLSYPFAVAKRACAHSSENLKPINQALTFTVAYDLWFRNQQQLVVKEEEASENI